MKLFILSAFCGTLLSFSVVGQETTKPVEPETPKVSIGVLADVNQSMANLNQSYEGNFKNLGAGFFLRHHIGNHCAVETGMMVSFSEPIMAPGYYAGPFPPPVLRHKMHAQSWEVPLHFQYHLGKRNAALRPYFGLGLGILMRNYDVHEWGKYYPNTYESERDYTYNLFTYFAQLTQGVTYRINDRMQFNQSLYIQGERQSRTNFGLRFRFRLYALNLVITKLLSFKRIRLLTQKILNYYF